MDRSGVDASEALAGKLRTLIQLIELTSSSLDTDEILRQIAAAAVRLTDARCASLWVADEATRTVELRACSDAAIGAGHPNPHLAYGQGVAGWVTLHDEPITASDLRRTPMVARAGMRPTVCGACTLCRSRIRTPWSASSCSWPSSPSASRARSTRSSRP